jgi:hypothetical protein
MHFMVPFLDQWRWKPVQHHLQTLVSAAQSCMSGTDGFPTEIVIAYAGLVWTG